MAVAIRKLALAGHGAPITCCSRRRALPPLRASSSFNALTARRVPNGIFFAPRRGTGLLPGPHRTRGTLRCRHRATSRSRVGPRPYSGSAAPSPAAAPSPGRSSKPAPPAAGSPDTPRSCAPGTGSTPAAASSVTGPEESPNSRAMPAAVAVGGRPGPNTRQYPAQDLAHPAQAPLLPVAGRSAGQGHPGPSSPRDRRMKRLIAPSLLRTFHVQFMSPPYPPARKRLARDGVMRPPALPRRWPALAGGRPARQLLARIRR